MKLGSVARSEFLHKANRLIADPGLKLLAAVIAEKVGIRHTVVRFDPVSACNLRCKMCYFSDIDWRASNTKGRFSKDEIERIADLFFQDALQVHIGASMEPTIFKDYPWLVKVAKSRDVPFVGFTTNGQLLTLESLEKMAAFGLDEITISVHGVRKETYEAMMPGASFDKLVSVFNMLDTVTANTASKFRVRVNYTANSQNIDELPEFFDVFGRYNLHTVQIRPVFDFGLDGHEEFSLKQHTSVYSKALLDFAAQCRTRNVRLLANRIDPAHSRPNPSAFAYELAYLRAIDPRQVWRPDFNWRSETPNQFKKRSGWTSLLLREAVRSRRGRPFPPAQSGQSDLLS